MGVVFNEIGIFQAFFDDYVDHGEGQGIVAPWAQLQPEIGLLGEEGFAGIDNDNFLRMLKGIAGVEAGLAVRAGIERLVAPIADAFGLRIP